MFLHKAVGAVTSLTTTLAVHVWVFPLLSVAFSDTMLVPILAQVKLEGVSSKLKLQLSEVPLSTDEGSMVTVPVTFRLATKFLHLATGDIKSLIVTMAVQKLELPL